MIALQSMKKALAINPALVNGASFTAIAIDTLGFAYATIDFLLGATDIALSALKLQECDTSGGSYADVSGSIVGTDAGIDGTTSVLPSATDDNKVWTWDLDLRKRKRFLKVVATVGSGSVGANGAALVTLDDGEVSPDTATQRGAANVLRP